MRAIKTTTTAKATFSPPITVVHRSPWHSPVPYLFFGLSAMLGLISFALLILACSYWKLYSGGGEAGVAGVGESTAKGEIGTENNAPAVSEESRLVIMAGDVKPTYLATPAASSKKICLSCKNCKDDILNDRCNDRENGEHSQRSSIQERSQHGS